MKFYVVVVEDVEKLQFKFHDNQASFSMATVFFSAFGCVKKPIFGYFRYLEFSKISFFFSGNGK